MWYSELLSEPPLKRDGNNLIYSSEGSDDWQRRQDESVDRYRSDDYEADPTIGHMFGNFIATTLEDRSSIVLDVGCGLFPTLPHYAAELNLTRFIGLEPLTTPVDRSYVCIVGAVAERIPLKSGSVDAALFGTSLDHIEAEDAAIEEVKRVLKPNGRLYFWQGLYDADYMPRDKDWAKIFTAGPLPKRIGRWILAPAEYAYLILRMRRRARQLKNNNRIDDIHFRYYTRERLNDSLKRWGLTKVRELQPPGQSSIFVEAHR
jgi:SAM-dependent methyltransferase